MSWLTTVFDDIKDFFVSPKAQAVEQQIASLMPVAFSIVSDIAAMTPNKTVQEVNTVAQKYGVPLATSVANDPTSIGNSLMNIATEVLQKNHAPSAATSLLNTVVQLAVTAVKANVPPPAPAAA